MVYSTRTPRPVYSPATVSNAPITQDEEARALKQLLHLYSRRFGRDAILALGFWIIERFSDEHQRAAGE